MNEWDDRRLHNLDAFMHAGLKKNHIAEAFGISLPRLYEILKLKYPRWKCQRARDYTPPMETDPDLVEAAWRRLDEEGQAMKERQIKQGVEHAASSEQEPLITASDLETMGILRKGTAYRMAKAGLIPFYQCGVGKRGVRFMRSEVLAALRRPMNGKQEDV